MKFSIAASTYVAELKKKMAEILEYLKYSTGKDFVFVAVYRYEYKLLMRPKVCVN